MTTTTSKPTIRDVARVCGVSVATVSYVINGTRVLKQETRDRVQQAMEEMNYTPSAVARGLLSKRVHTLGVHCSVVQADQFITNPYAAGILSGILNRAQIEEFDVTLFTNRWQNVQTSAPALCDGRTDGMIALAPPLHCDMIEGLAGLHLPLVAIASQPHDGIATVDVDNFAGARMAARHLIELGHQRIGAILGNEDMASFAPRLRGFRAALNEANLEARAQDVVVSHFDGSLAFEQARQMLRQQQPRRAPRPTAICAGNDAIAIEIIEAARSMNLRVPDDLSIIGFDDLPMASVVRPNLTTIRQPLRAIGERAASLLIEQMRGQPPETTDFVHLLQPELVVRQSCAPLHSAC